MHFAEISDLSFRTLAVFTFQSRFLRQFRNRVEGMFSLVLCPPPAQGADGNAASAKPCLASSIAASRNGSIRSLAAAEVTRLHAKAEGRRQNVELPAHAKSITESFLHSSFRIIRKRPLAPAAIFQQVVKPPPQSNCHWREPRPTLPAAMGLRTSASASRRATARHRLSTHSKSIS